MLKDNDEKIITYRSSLGASDAGNADGRSNAENSEQTFEFIMLRHRCESIVFGSISCVCLNGKWATSTFQGPADGTSGRLVRGPAGDYTDYGRLLQMRERYGSVCNELFQEEDVADWDRLIEYEIKFGDDAPFLREEQERLKTRSVTREACRTLFWETEEDKKNQWLKEKKD